MIAAPRLLLVHDVSDVGQAILTALADNNLLHQSQIVRDEDEALLYLNSCGDPDRESSGLPAVVLLGPDLRSTKSLSLLEHIRQSPTMQHLPVIMLMDSRSEEALRRAYELGINGVVVRSDDSTANAERLNAILQFWAIANVPPPGCLRSSELDAGERA